MSEGERLAELFEQALAVPAAERASFLESACGKDRQLLEELEALIASHAAQPDYLDRVGDAVMPIALDALDEDSIDCEGEIIGRYEILDRLGRGGMGEVYRARDVELDRHVALKFLSPHLTTDPTARARLLNEARAVSAIEHPNISVIHEIGESVPTASVPESRLFIAMAYCEGQSLDKKLADGALSVDEALDYAIQLVDGLVTAHEAGIIHRDIKPANLIVDRRGVLKLIDFGIAKRADVELAIDGSSGGTVEYMSPEQTMADNVDHRSDIWSTGVVLYEMLAGSRPFQGERDVATIHRIRHDEPPPLTSSCPRVSPAVAAIVSRCLAKPVGHRYADASTLLADLRLASAEVARTPSNESLVVLPFANTNPDPEDEFLSDGLTEELIASLSKLKSLRVISRTSTMRLKGSDRDVRAIARQLEVGYALEGSVRRSDKGLLVTARLIDAERRETVWSGSFEGSADDVFAIHGRVARSVAEALRVHLSAGERSALATHRIRDPRAYEAYLRARHEAWRFSSDGLARARRHIETALEIVGDNELLYGTLGHIAAMHFDSGIGTGENTIAAIEDIVEKLFSLEPRSARGHWLRCWIAFQRGDLKAAIGSGERSYALDPDNSDTLLMLAYVYLHAGYNDDARALLARTMRLDPLTPLSHAVQGFAAILEGRFADAVQRYERVEAMDPESPFGIVFHGWALAYDRRIQEAAIKLRLTQARFPRTVFASYASALAHALEGSTADALSAITPEFLAAARHSEMFARELAHCYALAGETDKALDWLEREVELGMANYAFLAEHDWFLDPLREEPRFRAVLDRLRPSATDRGL